MKIILIFLLLLLLYIICGLNNKYKEFFGSGYGSFVGTPDFKLPNLGNFGNFNFNWNKCGDCEPDQYCYNPGIFGSCQPCNERLNKNTYCDECPCLTTTNNPTTVPATTVPATTYGCIFGDCITKGDGKFIIRYNKNGTLKDEPIETCDTNIIYKKCCN